MKAKHGLILIALGYLLQLITRLLTFFHLAVGKLITLVDILSPALIVTGIILLGYKVITYPKWKDFFNS